MIWLVLVHDSNELILIESASHVGQTVQKNLLFLNNKYVRMLPTAIKNNSIGTEKNSLNLDLEGTHFQHSKTATWIAQINSIQWFEHTNVFFFMWALSALN